MGNLKEEVFATYTEWVKECAWFTERFKALSDAGERAVFRVSVTLMESNAFMVIDYSDDEGDWNVKADTIDTELDRNAFAEFKDAVRRKVAALKEAAQQRADKAGTEMRSASAWLSNINKLSQD